MGNSDAFDGIEEQVANHEPIAAGSTKFGAMVLDVTEGKIDGRRIAGSRGCAAQGQQNSYG
jgi:hypothetical protein